MDSYGHQEGPLVGTGFSTVISGGYEDGLLWSNDGTWFYNGHTVAGTPFAQTLTTF